MYACICFFFFSSFSFISFLYVWPFLPSFPFSFHYLPLQISNCSFFLPFPSLTHISFPARYPPPKPQGQTITPIHNNNNNSSKSSRKGGSSGTATPQNGTLPKSTPTPRIPDQSQRSPQLPQDQQEGLIQQPSTQDEMNRIRKYEVSVCPSTWRISKCIVSRKKRWSIHTIRGRQRG